MIKDMQGRLAGHLVPPGEIVFRAPGTLEAEAQDAQVDVPLTFANVEDLRRFVRAEVHENVLAELDAIAREFHEHPALRAFPRAEGNE